MVDLRRCEVCGATYDSGLTLRRETAASYELHPLEKLDRWDFCGWECARAFVEEYTWPARRDGLMAVAS